jgi:hypothetical protein
MPGVQIHLIADDARCIHCGCTQARACPGGCWWVCVDAKASLGICSTCSTGDLATDMDALRAAIMATDGSEYST